PRLLVLFIRLLHPPTATLFPYTTLFRSYRTDLLEQAGVEVPTTVAELAEAATTVKDELGVTGIALGTQAGTASATEGIESIFQSAGCSLLTDGAVTLDSPGCAEAAGHFRAMRDSS